MNKFSAFMMLVVATSSAFAGQGKGKHGPSAASLRYFESRQAITEPSFGLTKVKALVKKLSPDAGFGAGKLPNYDSLSFEEKFTYNMIHGENWSQSCMMITASEGQEKKLEGYINFKFPGDGVWSDRQISFMAKNRTKVLDLLRKTIQERGRAGMNLKSAVLEVKGWELIPDLAAVYKANKYDHDILTTMTLLMSYSGYKPFTSTALSTKLYGKSTHYYGGIDLTPAIEKQVLDLAAAFHKSKMG